MATLTLQPDAAAGLDTFIHSTQPAANFGTDGTLWLGERAGYTQIGRSLIKFDLSGLPDGAIVSSATLSLTVGSDLASEADYIKVYRQKRAWVESEATWSIYSTGNSWQTAGGFGADDCEQTEIGSLATSASEPVDSVLDIPLTPTTKSGLDLGNGWLLKTEGEADDLYIHYSSDYGPASSRPKLVIEYTVPTLGYAAIF